MNPKVRTHAAEKLFFGQSNEKIATFISNKSKGSSNWKASKVF